MSSRSLTEILLANRPELAAHLEAQVAEMRAPRPTFEKPKPRRRLRVAAQAGVAR